MKYGIQVICTLDTDGLPLTQPQWRFVRTSQGKAYAWDTENEAAHSFCMRVSPGGKITPHHGEHPLTEGA